jgi:hypothetical protein
MEAEDTAPATLGFGDEEWGGVGRGVWLNVGEQRGEVVIEGEDAGVGGVVEAAGTSVGGTEIAGGIVAEAGRGGLLRRFALPGALGPLRGDDDPLTEKRVVAAVRDEVERARRGGHRESFSDEEVTVSSVSDEGGGNWERGNREVGCVQQGGS